MAAKTPAVRLGIDLGGTKIHAVAIGPKGKVLGSARIATKAHRGYEVVVGRIANCAREALEEASATVRTVRVAGLAAPGPVDVERGVVLMAPNLGWVDKPLAANVARELGMPVVLGNDANLGGLGEVAFGAASAHRTAIAAFVGTGLGGAVIVEGRVLNGANGYAGELGHMPAPFGDGLCGCGRRGCLETVASKSGLVRQVAAVRSRRKPLLRIEDDKAVKSSDIIAALNAGCPHTRAAFDQLVDALGWGLATAGNVIDPEVFILGGGLVEACGKRLLPLVAARMAEHAILYKRHRPRLVMASLGDDAVAMGAAVFAAERRR
jgi:glucokinase